MTTLTITIFTLVALVFELCYIHLAKHEGIGAVRRYNGREEFVPVGGGVVFALAPLVALFAGGEGIIQYLWLVAGLLLAAMSYVDDLRDLPAKLRLLVQVVLVATVYYPVISTGLGWYILAVVFTVGYLNASNFMDGSNGMLAGYSLTAIAAVLYSLDSAVPVENYSTAFPSAAGISCLLTTLFIAVAVFAIFNFRPLARVYAGDVGSVTAGFFIAFGIATLAIGYGLPSAPIVVVLFLTDTFCTFMERLINGEPVLTQHKKHLYQRIIAAGKSPVAVAACYAAIQLAIDIIWLAVPHSWKNLVAGTLALVVVIVYILVKQRFLNKNKA